MLNKLIIFDIDGTLTNTNHIDSVCFEKAILDTLSISSIDTNWHKYKYLTDWGIVCEIIQEKLNRVPTSEEIETIRDTFVTYLEAAFVKDNSLCVPINGAQNIFENISILGWDIGIATGGWEKSAILKLKTAQIQYQNVPIGNSDDHFEREKIIEIAINRAEQFYKKTSYEKIVYIGDRVWDKNAANKLKINFIGIGSELKLINSKDFMCISNYADTQLEKCMTSLE
jgi:phosphoglycolate phosphatase-like HAD superfamily hydrolase